MSISIKIDRLIFYFNMNYVNLLLNLFSKYGICKLVTQINVKSIMRREALSSKKIKSFVV